MAHEDQYTPDQFHQALARSLELMESHQAAAVELLLDYNHGRIVEEPAWLRQFVAMGKSGRKASLRWDRLARALSGDKDTPTELTEAVRPYSDTERSVMRFAADLGSERWMLGRWDPHTRLQAAKAVTGALKVASTGSGSTNNTISGSVTGNAIQMGGSGPVPINWI